MTWIAAIESWFGWAPAWLISAIEFALAIGLALVLHALLIRALLKVFKQPKGFARQLVLRIQGLLRLAMLVVALAVASAIAPLSYGEIGFVQRLLQIAVIAVIAWIVWIGVQLWITLYLRRYTGESSDPFLSRKHITQTQILRRVAGFLIWLTAIAAALMSFDSVRQYGVSLLASAGAAGLILGLALQPVLKNLVAGIQIAVTQPIHIGDALTVEGEYGTVEDIKATFVLIRLWDLRRMVVPLSYFIEQPFHNWTRESSDLIGSVLIQVDFSLPVSRLRERARQVIEKSPLWDGKVFAVQVTDFRERTMEVRILMSAGEPPKLFDLRCQVREAIIEFLQADMPEALPHVRTAGGEARGEVAAALPGMDGRG